MTSFTRTESGVTNYKLFYGVDLVVFTEGGNKSYSFEEICEGKSNCESIDIKFWNVILTYYLKHYKFHFKAVGSKETARKICNLIVSNKIKNTLVTIDSDLDDFFGSKFISPAIIYTRGYSWENDVFCDLLIKKQISSFLLTPYMSSEIENEIDSHFEIFYRHASRLLKLELIYRSNNLKFISSCCGDSFIEKKLHPRLKIKEVLKLSNKKKIELKRPVRLNLQKNTLCPIMFTYGKLQLTIAIAIISFVCKKYTQIKTFPKDILITSMIEFYKAHTWTPTFCQAFSQ
ncbi:DUF4435 domain-containing protein [Nitrosomonas ureae]|uniref:Uncharacterized protein n=1 Tax=Nitrosomonas ureae TaxID=44577 RepID=A0A1H2HZ97_9PROT|nr:DUF4435 domain-containing protein [Nitrosomonas ureae]ALQ52083.1 hypothetical protein ATY38_13175 [Nitrosomonas ureae]SDU37212.1 Protein of unknown function [Nitrosomonas ureae]